MATRSRKVDGSVFPATQEGFRQLIDEANRLADEYRLLTVVRLDKTIAAVYVERPAGAPPGSSFYEDI